jgi:hypothetical protein
MSDTSDASQVINKWNFDQIDACLTSFKESTDAEVECKWVVDCSPADRQMVRFAARQIQSHKDYFTDFKMENGAGSGLLQNLKWDQYLTKYGVAPTIALAFTACIKSLAKVSQNEKTYRPLPFYFLRHYFVRTTWNPAYIALAIGLFSAHSALVLVSGSQSLGCA